MYMYFEAGSVLYILTAIIFAIFAYGAYANISIWRKGKARSLHRQFNKGMVFKTLFYEIILQLQVFKQSRIRWTVHIFIFYGFLGLLMHTGLLALLSHFVPRGSIISDYFFLDGGKLALDLWGDLFGSLLLMGVILAILRRYLFKVEQLDTIATDTIAIVLLLLTAVSGFLCEAVRIAQLSPSPTLAYSFLGNLLAMPIRGIQLPFNYINVVWVHVIISFTFLAYIPFGKMWHLFTSPIEILVNASEESSRKDIYGWAKNGSGVEGR